MAIILRRGGRRALVPFYRPMSLIDEMEELMGRRWDFGRPLEYTRRLVPHTDIYEDNGHLVMKTELPGINEKDLDITLEGDRLTVKAEKKDEVGEDTTHHARERVYGQYFRSITLPYPINGDKASATYQNGVLELRLPRAEESKAKRIEVKTQLPQVEGKKKEKKSE